MADQENKFKKYDLRTLEYQMNRGEISSKDYEKYLSGLSDDAENMEEVVLKDDDEAENPYLPENDDLEEDEDF